MLTLASTTLGSVKPKFSKTSFLVQHHPSSSQAYWLHATWQIFKDNDALHQHLSLCWVKGVSFRPFQIWAKLVLWPPHVKSWLIGKDSDAGRDWGQEEKGTAEDEMAGWHHQLDGRESEWTPGVGDGQGGLVCCDSWGHKESDTTELNWTEEKAKEVDDRLTIPISWNIRIPSCVLPGRLQHFNHTDFRPLLRSTSIFFKLADVTTTARYCGQHRISHYRKL